MKRFLRNNIYLVPPIMVVATFFSHFVEFNYIVIGNAVGYSLIASLPMIYIFWYSGKYCWFTKLSTLALPVMNLACILFVFLNYQQASYIFDVTIIALTVSLSIILSIQKKCF